MCLESLCEHWVSMYVANTQPSLFQHKMEAHMGSCTFVKEHEKSSSR
jgi:hypothetical protein